MNLINKQKHNYTCGHTAVTNVLRSLGKKISYKEGVDLVESIKYKDKNAGTWPYQLAAAFDKEKVSYEVIYNITLKKIQKHIKQGHKIVWLFTWYRPKRKEKRGAHWVFINDCTEKRMQVLNFSKKAKGSWYPNKSIIRELHQSAVYHPEFYSMMFIIKQE